MALYQSNRIGSTSAHPGRQAEGGPRGRHIINDSIPRSQQRLGLQRDDDIGIGREEQMRTTLPRHENRGSDRYDNQTLSVQTLRNAMPPVISQGKCKDSFFSFFVY